MNLRLKQIREHFGLSQDEMAQRLNLGQSSYSHLEVGRRKIIDRTVVLICNEFNVNENWLRTGNGEIFRNVEDNTLAELVNEYNLDKLGTSILKVALGLTKEQKIVLYEIAQKLVDEMES